METLSSEQIDLLLTQIGKGDSDKIVEKKMQEAEERAKLTNNAHVTLRMSWENANFLKEYLKRETTKSYSLARLVNALGKATQAVLDGKGDQTIDLDRCNSKGEEIL